MRAGETEKIGNAIQHGFSLLKPDPLLRKSIAAAYSEAKKRFDIQQMIDFQPTREELAAAPESDAPANCEELFKTLDRLKWKKPEQKHAAAVSSLIRLIKKDESALAKLRTFLDNKEVVGSDLRGSVTVGGRVAGLALTTLKDEAEDLDSLKPETRQLLVELATRPRLFDAVEVSFPLQNRRWPEFGGKLPLHLRRWLGISPPSPITKKLVTGVTVLDTLREVVHGTGPVEEIAKQVAKVVAADQIEDLVFDLYVREDSLFEIEDLKLNFSKISDEDWILSRQEIARRRVRLAAVASKILVFGARLESLLAKIEGDFWGPVLGVAVTAAAELAQGKVSFNPDRVVAGLQHIAFRDFAEGNRPLLAQCPDEAIEDFVRSIEGEGKWLYFDLLKPATAAHMASIRDRQLARASALRTTSSNRPAVIRTPSADSFNVTQ